MTITLAIVIPVFGNPWLTSDILHDIARESTSGSEDLRVIVVDNKGDYGLPRPTSLDVDIVTPGENLGWCAGSNLGISRAQLFQPEAYVLLNNDTRLSVGFFAGLVRAWQATGAALIGPRYDEGWWTQAVPFHDDARLWVPKEVHQDVPFLDGTCLLIPASTFTRIEGLRADQFGATGWGADLDLCRRAGDAGLRIVTTDGAFLNHFRGSTATVVHGGLNRYIETGDEETNRHMTAIWGPGWEVDLGIADMPAHVTHDRVSQPVRSELLPPHTGRSPEFLYLNLVARLLTGAHFPSTFESPTPTTRGRRLGLAAMSRALDWAQLRFVRPRLETPKGQLLQPVSGQPVTDVRCGIRTLDRLGTCFAAISAGRVSGDLVEVGSWRGGVAVFLRSLLEAHPKLPLSSDRRVLAVMAAEFDDLSALESVRRGHRTLAAYGLRDARVTVATAESFEVPAAIALLYINAEVLDSGATATLMHRVADGGWIVAEADQQVEHALRRRLKEIEVSGTLTRLDQTTVAYQRGSA